MGDLEEDEYGSDFNDDSRSPHTELASDMHLSKSGKLIVKSPEDAEIITKHENRDYGLCVCGQNYSWFRIQICQELDRK